MSTLTEENPIVVTDDTDSSPGDEIIHIVCLCNEDIAICGEPLDGPIYDTAPEEDECVVCVDLEFQRCPRCGEIP